MRMSLPRAMTTAFQCFLPVAGTLGIKAADPRRSAGSRTALNISSATAQLVTVDLLGNSIEQKETEATEWHRFVASLDAADSVEV